MVLFIYWYTQQLQKWRNYYVETKINKLTKQHVFQRVGSKLLYNLKIIKPY